MDERHQDDENDEKDEMESFRKKALHEINEYRRTHGCQPLKNPQLLNRYAQDWAEHLAEKNIFCHRADNKYGENLAMGSGNTWRNAVDMWYDEINKYDFNEPGYHPDTGHFTQLVWKSTKEVGIGIATNETSQYTVVVANFYPPGNVTGSFEENVFPQED